MSKESNDKQFVIWRALNAMKATTKFSYFVAVLIMAVLLLSLMTQNVFAERERIQIYSHSVSAPVGSSVLDKESIYYVAGKNLDITLNISLNATVKSVMVRGESIPLEESVGADPPDMYYSVIFEKRGRITIRLRFRNDGRGQSDPVKIIVGSRPLDLGSPTSFNPSTAILEFKLVRVKTVTRDSGNVTLSLSEAELRNKFLLAIWDKFGDDGEFVAETVDEDGNVKRITLYAPFYNEQVIQINNDGIHFRWGFKVSVDNACNPTITVTGMFRIDTNRNVVWLTGPYVSGDFAYYCVGHSVSQKQKDGIGQFIMSEIQSKVEEMFASLPSGTAVLINGIETRLNELRVTAVMPGDSVTIEVPYQGLSNDKPVNKGFAIRPGDDVLVMASGTTTLGIGANGLFNAKANPPIGDPNLAPSYGLSDEGIRLFSALAMTYREPPLMPMPQENVGALIVRRSYYTGGLQVVNGSPRYQSNYQFLGAIDFVSIPEASAGGWLTFGMNDYPETTLPSRNGTGTYTVAIVWF